MELFHTNMLYWLATERPDESTALWKAFGLTSPPVDKQSAFIRREWHHVDLVVSPGDDQPALVIENKIGAIPNPQQLDGYYAGLRSARPPFSVDASRFVLLTLTAPSFVPPTPWRSITYRDLLPALRETAQKLTGADAALVDAYVQLTTRLDEVARAYDPSADLDAPFALEPDEWQALNELRLLVIVEKVRASRFAEVATNKLTTELGEVGQVGGGFSNGSAIYEWFVPGPSGRLIGWQVQHGGFRLAVITGENDPHPRTEQEALVADLYAPYFDFSVPDEIRNLLGEYAGKKPWLHYAPRFVYRYAPLAPGTTWNDLLALATWFSRRAQEFAGSRQSDPSL
jgi:hypothetical protein